MEMTNTGLTASDVMALTKDNDGFGGVGLIILLFIFLIGVIVCRVAFPAEFEVWTPWI